IFSYLSSVLSSHPAETIAGLKDYNAFIELLRQ
ncbi:MAG: phosphoenolpyruvate-dependent sugar phosphotransferase system, EIIA 2 family protein, partial [Citrobacter sp.]